MKARTQGKIEQVKALMKALNLTMGAEEVIENNIIKKVVLFYDHEIYPQKKDDENKDTPVQQEEA